MPNLRVLKNAMKVEFRNGRRVLVLWPKPNRRQRALTKTKGRATAVKLHYTHDIYPVNAASAPDNRGRFRDCPVETGHATVCAGWATRTDETARTGLGVGVKTPPVSRSHRVYVTL